MFKIGFKSHNLFLQQILFVTPIRTNLFKIGFKRSKFHIVITRGKNFTCIYNFQGWTIIESKDIELERLDLDNKLEVKLTEEKKSLVKFIHVFESEPERRRIRKKLRKNNPKSKINREQHRLEKEHNKSSGNYYMNSKSYAFSMRFL